MRSVLVTGSSGFIGQHIVNRLLREGYDVTAVDIRPPVTGGEVLKCPFDDPAILRRVREGEFNAVIHQGAISSTAERDFALLQRVNVEGPIRLADACAEGNTRFLYASSSAVYGRQQMDYAITESDVDDGVRCSGPLNEYGHSKYAFDKFMTQDQTRIDWAGFRYTNVFGTNEEHKGSMASILSQIIRRVVTGKPVPLFADTLTASRDFVPVDFVVDVIVRSLGSSEVNGIFNLGSGVPVSFSRLLEWSAEIIRDATVTIELVPNSFASRYQYWTCADMSKLATALPDVRLLEESDVKRAVTRLLTFYRKEEVA